MTHEQAVLKLVAELVGSAADGGYSLNPDPEFVQNIADGLVVNEGRYGYRACPCRRAKGDAGSDADIVCPCDYRDADLIEYGACFCALYVSPALAGGESPAASIPERRPRRGAHTQPAPPGSPQMTGAAPRLSWPPAHPVWRCKVCGYLCARTSPPGLCPICKAESARFERFM